VQDERSGRAGPGSAASSAAQPASAPLTDCATAVADFSAAQAAAADKPGASEPPSADGTTSEFTVIVTIAAVDGQQITFTNDQPESSPPTSNVALLDDTTEWSDDGAPLEAPPTLAVGQQVALATSEAGDGVNHVSFIDVGADAAGDGAALEAKGQMADEKAKRAQDDTSDSGEPDSAATKDPEPVVDSDSSMVPDATGKSRGTRR